MVLWHHGAACWLKSSSRNQLKARQVNDLAGFGASGADNLAAQSPQVRPAIYRSVLNDSPMAAYDPIAANRV
jgi:hypothetical protein